MLKLKRNLLSVALASATMMLAHGVHAQSADENADTEDKNLKQKSEEKAVELDSYTVTGILGSIQRSVAIKQDSNSIVEAVSAEDIGKLPDISIADSIARLPGLSAQRVAGRASSINIRGLAGDFSTTLLNGREQVSAGDNRGVEFDQYPSELLSGVTVYKTPDATLPAQGLSGTVNLQTVKPLSYSGAKASLNFRLEENSLGELNSGFTDKGNRFSASYIGKFADDTIGFAVGYARLDSPGQFKSWGAWGYPTQAVNGEDTIVLGGTDHRSGSSDNVRDGLMAVLEFAPNDVYTGTLDLYYSTFEKAETTRRMEFGLGWGSGTLSNPNVQNGFLLGGTYDGVRPVVRNDFDLIDDRLFAVGFNNEFWINEDFRAIADFSTSSADRDQRILETYSGAAGGDLMDFTLDPINGPANLVFGLDYSDPNVVELRDPGGWGQAGYDKDFEIKDDLKTARLALERSFLDGPISSIEAGVNFSNREKSRSADEAFLDLPAGVTSVPIPSQFLSGPTRLAYTNTGMVAYNAPALAGSVYVRRPNNCFDCAAKNWAVEEDIITAYLQLNIDTELGSVPVRGNFGLQNIDVDQESRGLGLPGGDPSQAVPTSDGADYDDLLPSLNLAFMLPADQTVRFGAARQQARPRMDEMRFFANFGIDQQRNIWTGGGGNARLRPWEADSFDLSYEKYFEGKGYFSAAVFHKDLKTYIYNQTNFNYDFGVFDLSGFSNPPPSTIGEFSQPANGDGGTINGYEFAGSIPLGMWVDALDGFGLIGSYSDTRSSIQPLGPGNSQPLPGLSRYVGNLTAYYEKEGFSARISQRSRSSFIGEIQAFGGDRGTRYIRGEDIIDFQTSYEFQSGTLDGLTLLLQVNNLTNEEYREFFRDPGVIDRPRLYVEYGRTVLLGLTYKF
ncbi:TonB-dependent receptor [Pseudomarimonas arenosa]|uniref:TonB-dependent receptor n=1 Tax=Pseudomarimonas arenosa TaxID=2774145 RepID=A0AAW3ZR36_9GAMM|nr:TonB-dependent receptor [Pseudomarimonas arenosa]MBD8527365.1 TonB-dependent receptor [Pseudomarimonas arenosa]